MAPTIKDPITIDNLPGTPDGTVAPTPGRPFIVRANPLTDYVAGGVGGSGQWYSNYARTLPYALDDVTSDFGDDLYDRMLLDPQVASAITVLKASIIEDGLHLLTRHRR